MWFPHSAELPRRVFFPDMLNRVLKSCQVKSRVPKSKGGRGRAPKLFHNMAPQNSTSFWPGTSFTDNVKKICKATSTLRIFFVTFIFLFNNFLHLFRIRMLSTIMLIIMATFLYGCSATLGIKWYWCTPNNI